MADKTKSPDDLVTASPEGLVELSEDQLEASSGGRFGIQKDKMQSANKNSDAVKGLL